MSNNQPYFFNISLSILNHLGRNLYRSFTSVLGEAISNSWDADAHNVWIDIDKDNNTFVIEDDGLGMSSGDFQDRFLKVGFSKRKEGGTQSPSGRPFIGRKGIGKLALLSCAKKVTIISKETNGRYIGGSIDNGELDRAIHEDSSQYILEVFNQHRSALFTHNQKQGTKIMFEVIQDGIKNKLAYIQKIIALYFRFSLLDNSFNIYLNGDKITVSALNDLTSNTEFMWNINQHEDPYIDQISRQSKEKGGVDIADIDIKGFFATVEKPSNLKIVNSEEKIGIDLFVNGRIREKNILKHLPDFATRYIASYLYGQLHCNSLDGDDVDRFTSSRENIVANDKEFSNILDRLLPILNNIADKWDKWRLKHKEEGDSENTKRMSLKERKAKSLVEETSKEYIQPQTTKRKTAVNSWIDELETDARFNVGSYVDCFMSENLIRKYIQNQKIPIPDGANKTINEYKKREKVNKNKGNISIDIREYDGDTSYLAMDEIAGILEQKDRKDRNQFASLFSDAKEYKPLRDAVAHTARLTQVAKDRLTAVYENIKGRLNQLLSSK